MRNWCNWEHPCLPSRCCEFESRIPLQGQRFLVFTDLQNEMQNKCNVAGCGACQRQTLKLSSCETMTLNCHGVSSMGLSFETVPNSKSPNWVVPITDLPDCVMAV